jgi:glycosyltransferase involved in cell wall biosynthesis
MGGAERVCLATIEALKQEGHFVVLGVIEQTNWEKIKHVFGRVTLPDIEIPLVPFNFTMLRVVYTSLLSPLVFSAIHDKCDLTICTTEDLMLLSTDFGYMHYVPLCLNNTPSESQYFRHWFLTPYRKLQSHMLKNLEGKTLISNSHFTQQALERVAGYKSTVIYPPVNLNHLAPPTNREARGKAVLTVGRFSPEKNFEFVLSLAEMLPTVRFTIIGTFSGARATSYYRKLVKVREVKKLKNVLILHDCPASTVSSALNASSIFLNAMTNEPFGMAVAEAMASGLVPVVHRSGGPWMDILDETEGKYGYSYTNLEEATQIIQQLLDNPNKLAEIAERSRQRAQVFSYNNFKRNIVKIIHSNS